MPDWNVWMNDDSNVNRPQENNQPNAVLLPDQLAIPAKKRLLRMGAAGIMGGLSTGPKTLEGKERALANLKQNKIRIGEWNFLCVILV